MNKLWWDGADKEELDFQFEDHNKEGRASIVRNHSRFSLSDVEVGVLGITAILVILILAAWCGNYYGFQIIG